MSGPESAHAGGGFDLLRRATQAMMSKISGVETSSACPPSIHLSQRCLAFRQGRGAIPGVCSALTTPPRGLTKQEEMASQERLSSVASCGPVSTWTHDGASSQPLPFVGTKLVQDVTAISRNPPRHTLGTDKSARTAATDEDGVDHIGFETPRSGVATPHPDPHDKRLPGIMSYFAQVRQDLPTSQENLSTMSRLERGMTSDRRRDQHLVGCSSTELRPPQYAESSRLYNQSLPIETPCSRRSKSLTICTRATAGTMFSGGETTSVSSSGTSGRSEPVKSTAWLGAIQAPPGKWFSLQGLKGLTRGIVFKSGPPTPTRALSTANSHSDGRETPNGSGNDGAETSGTVTPKNSGAQAPTAKGRLTIKIVEARGIRKSRDPYAVAVFQRSELISSGPHAIEEEEHVIGTPSGLGAIPMKRQVSDSGRPMAIPMRSRQSSNTSISDYNTFRNRASRTLYSSPKWDAEAVFDVVDSDMVVDISVYDHAASGEEFLGHVNLEARKDKDSPVRGWFALQGHANTTVDNIPTGEIFVEVAYQRTERKHFGPSDFEILKLIGKGTFGQVYQVRKRDTQRIYAMKVLQKKVIVQKKEVAHTVGERNILVRTATSDSPFIVGLKFSFQTPSELYLVTDYMSGGELFWHLQKEGRFDERRAKFYIAELILSIQHLHNNDIVYRDLKPENILLDANGHIALCDFGLSKANLTKNDTTNTFCGTTEYLAPEVLLDESGYTKMVDFWSLGVLVFEMCCGWSPFYAEDTQQMYKNIAFGKVRFPRDTLSQEGRNFVKGLLNRNPKHRLGATDDAEELKRHPFFNDIDWNLLAKKLITPPFKPKLKSATDVSYFDPEFTTALDQNGSLNERAAALARGYAASTPLSPSVQANFHGFTYVDESALDDHMRDTSRVDDEDMDDAHTNGDDDWDNLDDIDPRKSNRMSGIVKSGHDEQMVGGSQFDP
ncbi:serine threonine- kinase sck1 [Trichoderma cornu-damae]|uniref:non-specific serine/threonine protein kinase n=1 Tax=Trichoderma cornu-damae TaxID=654480 RepID=A0A9P8TWD4_9HYPO|nr:serine threonine- kinase sck1 [Trichoderma cornu-damae]